MSLQQDEEAMRSEQRIGPIGRLTLSVLSCDMDNVLRAWFICSFLMGLMDGCRIHFLTAVITLSVSFLGVFVHVVLVSDFGQVEVMNTILIADGGAELDGLLYRLVSASALKRVSVIVLVLNVGETADCIFNV